MGAEDHGKSFYFSYLVAYMFTLSLALGALFFVIVQHVARAGWSIVVRRIAENMASTLPALLLLFLPIVMGKDVLFEHWMHAELEQGKPGYDAIIAGNAGQVDHDGSKTHALFQTGNEVRGVRGIRCDVPGFKQPRFIRRPAQRETCPS